MSGSDFLKKKYDLHNAPEVEAAAQRTSMRTGQEISRSNTAALIQNYLDRFKEILDRPDPEKRERGVEALKGILHEKFVIKESEIPESYWEGLRRIARERGQGADIEQVDWETLKQQTADGLIADQRSSLDAWIDYFASTDAPYPDWLKYFAIRGILGMGDYDKEKKRFTKRSQGTVKPYPDINREALAYVLDALEKKCTKRQINLTALAAEDTEEFERLLQSENFAKLYAWAIEKLTPASAEQLQKTEGKWVRYQQGSDHMPLVASIQGHGTGWCTAGESTAATQLAQGDFFVYYSNDAQGNSTIPRAAIRMEGDKIAEVRGIAEQQNLDNSIAPVVEKKLQEFPDGKAYAKKVSDMKCLTVIEQKMEDEEVLTSEDLRFLYEIDSSIDGFGYSKDPRIVELRSRRNPEEDMPILFACTPSQIVHRSEDISAQTKAYVGPLEPGIFDLLPRDLVHIYTSFPEGRLRREALAIGGHSAEELETALTASDGQGHRLFQMSSYVESMLRNEKQFIAPVNERYRRLKGKEEGIDLVRLRVSDLGFPSGATTKELFERARAFGLELCPPEMGPHYRLLHTEQSLGDWCYVGMDPITHSDGRPRVFNVGRDEDGLWLNDRWAEPDRRWNPRYSFLFRLRTSDA